MSKYKGISYKKSISRKSKSRKNRKSRKGYTIPISIVRDVECCMCEKNFNRNGNGTLVPLTCLRKYGERAHRICQNCWWSEFAVENGSHECPGCKKHLPLTTPLKKNKPTSEEIIIL